MRDKLSVAAFIDASSHTSKYDLLPLCGSTQTLKREKKNIELFGSFLEQKEMFPNDNICCQIQRFFKCPCEDDNIETQIGRSFNSFSEDEMFPIYANIEVMRDYTNEPELEFNFEGCPWFLLNDEIVQTVRVYFTQEEMFTKPHPKEMLVLVYQAVSHYKSVYNKVYNRIFHERQKEFDKKNKKGNGDQTIVVT